MWDKLLEDENYKVETCRMISIILESSRQAKARDPQFLQEKMEQLEWTRQNLTTSLLCLEREEEKLYQQWVHYNHQLKQTWKMLVAIDAEILLTQETLHSN